MAELQIPRPREAFDHKEMLRALRAFISGDFSVRMPTGLTGIDGELAEAFNDIVRMNEAMTREFARVRDQVGKEGKISQRAGIPAAGGSWAACVDSVNTLIDDLARPIYEAAHVMDAVAKGDLSKKFTSQASGDIGALADAVNRMIGHLATFADHVSDVAREVGVAGRPGGRAKASGPTGLWRRATDNVNQLAAHPAILQTQKEALQRTNRQLEQNARQLSEQMKQVEQKNEEVERAKAALEEKARQLALSSGYKSEFLANMSHELRTPLNSLLILAQMLAENPASNLTAKQIEYAQTIHAAGNDLLALINDVLDLAKVESGTVALNLAAERMAGLSDFLDRAFGQAGHHKDLKFRIEMQTNLPPVIWTDAKRLRQILKNLLSNAFKFTAKGSVLLEVSVVTSGWAPGHPVLDAAEKVVAFAVIDTGIGVAPDKQQIIFEAFRQADGTTSRRFGGTGLGLSISAKLAHLLGGEIGVQSRPGKGSTFTLFLPLVQPTRDENIRPGVTGIEFTPAGQGGAPVEPFRGPAQLVSDERPASMQNAIADGVPGIDGKIPELAHRKVLLIDDDIRNIFALTGVLETQGMIVMNAENGLEGIEKLKSDPQIDIVLVDMMMPELDGYDTIRAMRSLDRLKGVPIIGVSAKAMKGDREKCIAAGASDYISKPVNVDHLLSLLRQWLLA